VEILLLRLALAGIAGFMLGLISNRQDKTRSGRVFAIVSISSALLYIIAAGIYEETPGVGDPARLTASIPAALGFLFAGLVHVRQDRRGAGTTTAAALLLSALVGLLIADGSYTTVLLGIFFFILIYWISGFMRGRQLRTRGQVKARGKNNPG